MATKSFRVYPVTLNMWNTVGKTCRPMIMQKQTDQSCQQIYPHIISIFLIFLKRQFAWFIRSYFFGKIRKISSICCLLNLPIAWYKLLTLEAPSKVCSRRHSKFFHFSYKISLEISYELSAWQTIHMKCQDLFSEKKKYIYSKVLSAAVVTDTLRVKRNLYSYFSDGGNICGQEFSSQVAE